MKTIKIGSKLTPTQAQRINRKARHEGYSFVKVGRKEYALRHDCIPEMEVSYLHSEARKMMVIAGTTFRYEICA
ncbi:MAG: hypothetical protein EBR82_22435 [Caulobacteraceae bacterium]|nr:hypothetical protein [Caulobacteraceae bacterium]